MEKNNEDLKIAYVEKVDVTFTTYKKSLLDCISYVSTAVQLASSMESEQLQENIALINLLNNQFIAVDKFIKGYTKIKEAV